MENETTQAATPPETQIPPELFQRTYSSMKQAAGACQIPLTIIRLAKSKGAPGFDSAGRVDMRELKPWIDGNAGTLQEAAQENSREYWSLEKLKAEAQIEKHKLESLQGKYLAKEDVARQLTALVTAAKSVLVNQLENELPPKLAGLDAIAIKELTAQTVNEVCKLLSGGELWK